MTSRVNWSLHSMTDQDTQRSGPPHKADLPDNSGQLSDRLDHLQIQQVVQQFPFFGLISLVAIVAVAILYASEMESRPAAYHAWIAGSVSLVILVMYGMRLLGSQADRLAPAWLPRMIPLGAGLMGGIWGVAAVLYVTAMPDIEKNFSEFYRPTLFAVLICWQAINALSTYITRFKSFLLFVTLAFVPGLLYLAITPSLINNSMAGVGSLFYCFIVLSGRRLSEISFRSQWLQLRNEDLIRFLENSKNTVESVNRQLASEIEERRSAEAQLQEINLNLEQKVRERTLALSDINRALRSSQERLTLAIDASGIGLWDWNLVTNEIYHSNFEQLLGYSRLELKAFMGQMHKIIHPEDYAQVRRALVHHLRKRRPLYEAAYRIRHRLGHWIWVEDSGRVVAWNEKGMPIRLIGTRRDITPERETEEKLRLSASVFEHAAEGIYILDGDMRYLSVNPRFSQITGYSDDELHGRHIFEEALTQPGKQMHYPTILQGLNRDGEWQGEITEYRKSGQPFPEWLHISAVHNGHTEVTHYVGIISDLSQRKEAEEKLRYLSNYDRLTGLANRNLFRDRLHAAILRARDQSKGLAVLYIDMDRFRTINDSLGHELGDELLKKVGERLINAAVSADTLARIGSDEFTVILDQQVSRGNLEAYCEKIIDELRRPFRIGEHELLLGVSIGVSLFPEHGRELQVLINHADLALQQAKRMGGNTMRFFSSDVHVVSVEQVNLESALRKAIFRDEFVVYYQPKVCLKSGLIVGMEALVRWMHPSMGLLGPGQFIPLAEEAGLISAIGEIVLDKACRQTRAWQEQGFGHISTSVNVVAQQLNRGNLLEILDRVLVNTGLDPELLELEITESSLMEDRDEIQHILEEVRMRGIQIALDDFGTGYSSLSYLKRFPIDILKIDQSFIFEIGHNENDEAIVRAIFAMAQSLGLKVVAEGVETQQHMDFLREQDCDLVQGFFISRPVPADDITVLLERQRQSLPHSASAG
ncbi:MAG: EAL domain-containing protein [Fluviicoccus sp.]|uniref:putative bifunctional diguanylate cyclase/phosphodiesterase n=1 Tax=Fluviicoccus sp. TaxID=2003552 RepID=UPI00271F3FDD|nr:EAL domain-containing protein [Fluviicoccus sp.]MDO8329699.1 EAL domain-containing protein [Fluviicoccus sp.]